MTPEQRVEVDQQALIDKILARYSGEFTLFRELLQNADDAESSNAEIRFETATHQHHTKGDPTPPLVVSNNVTEFVEWVFRNDGKKFDNDDWKRLPKIAHGNPKPEKIGAFGVGFYSLFSVTDKPCVSSGGHEMRFYWKNGDNQLYASHHDLPQQDHWTTFRMPLRMSGPLPSSVLDLMRFLASSVIFMVNLTAVSVFFDNDRIGCIRRSHNLPQTINVPDEMEWSSPKGVMRVTKVKCHRITIEAEIKMKMKPFSGAKDVAPKGIPKSQIDLKTFTAEVDAVVDENYSQKLYRCIKKKLPLRLEYSLIYTGKDAYDCNSIEQGRYPSEVASIFRGLHADLEGAKHTRIFIGHATGQTTGIGGHMASHFIPTVERESIDFVDADISVWNKELLYIGGFLSRLVYDLELSDIQCLWEEAITGVPDPEQLLKSQDDLHSRFLHVLKFFAFHDSTPSPMVAQDLRDSFYNCSTLPPQFLSSTGVRAAPNVRTFNPQVARFLDSIPMLPKHVSLGGAQHVNGLPPQYKISQVTVKDVLQALRGQPLSEEKLVFCFQWWLELKRKGKNSNLRAAELSNTVTFNNASGKECPLSLARHFINNNDLGAHIPLDGPLPASLIPFKVSRDFVLTDLKDLGWKELTIMDWFQHISHEDVISQDLIHDFTQSPNWAGRVLYTLSRAWSSLSDEEHRTVKAALEKTQCIPTSRGLCRPDESYLPIANDALLRRIGLSVVTLTGSELGGEMRSFLLFIGAKTQIPVELLLNRMLDTEEWSVSDFIGHLVKMSPLSTQYISTLRSSKAFFKECCAGEVGKKSRYRADELYPPVETFRQCQLPVIEWHKESKWLDGSDEANLLYHLGLHRYPPLKKIIELCASSNVSVGKTAFMYLCDNLRSKYSEYNANNNFHDVAFVPAENKKGSCLKSPRDVFLGIQWKALDFSIVRDDYRHPMISELGIQQYPPPLQLFDLLETRPPSYEEAPEWLEWLFECTRPFTQDDRNRLSGIKFVPTRPPNPRKWLTPTECYLGTSKHKFYSELFVFVNFGPGAKQFLSYCGSKEEPSVKDVAECLIRGPDRFYELAGTPECFLEKLRDIATQEHFISNGILDRMRLERTLLGKRRERIGGQDEGKTTYCLRKPKEIVIVDDLRDYELFQDVVYVAPQDELLESFYSLLGCRQMSTVIHARYEDSIAISDPQTCSEYGTLIRQRLPSFLKKCSHHRDGQTHGLRAEDIRVKVCEKILVHKTLSIGSQRECREQNLWAVTKCNQGNIELWLSHHAEQDMYDLAACLCRHLFGTVKFTDTVLLVAMLSDSKLLKRAGFEVGQSSEEKSSELLANAPINDGGGITRDNSHSSANPSIIQSSLPQSIPGHFRRTIADTLNKARDKCQTAKHRFIPSLRRSTTSKHTTISRELIQDIVSKATKACSPGSNQAPDDEDEIFQFLRSHSCYDFAQGNKFRRVCTTQEGVEFHVAGDEVPHTSDFNTSKRDPMARFLLVMTPAISAYKLQMKSLHIFYESGGGPIAFNSNRSIYLNLRYFEEWRGCNLWDCVGSDRADTTPIDDEDVKNGRLRRAQLSWFFVLAHEIAHNITRLHDATHEFWLSQICEAHMDDFLRPRSQTHSVLSSEAGASAGKGECSTH